MNPDTLPNGHQLNLQRYTITQLSRQSASYFTYEGHDKAANKAVIIKEYFFENHTKRNADGTLEFDKTISPLFLRYKPKVIKLIEQLSQVRHPHLVEILDYFTENNTVYLVLKKVGGQTLYNMVLKSGALPEKEGVLLLFQVASALEKLHEHNLYHLNVSPDNILISPSGKAVLIDYLMLNESTKFFRWILKSSITSRYTPLEVIHRQQQTGNFSDVYSLAATFYFGLSGTMPLHITERMHNHLPGPQAFNKVISHATDETLMKALSTRPELRFQQVDEFVWDLASQHKNYYQYLHKIDFPLPPEINLTPKHDFNEVVVHAMSNIPWRLIIYLALLGMFFTIAWLLLS
ncbi:protein kinase [Rapidithrix thailandica]|uniref:Protein kinase n=1 Tax=Rapidithrix thailandica TaxID=413964 RepID=A0AAW9S0S5_9BACT